MNSVQQLLQHYLKPGLTTIVYGNLATRYNLIKYYIDLMFDDLNIEFRTKESNIELYCDVLVWFNPEFGEHVYRPNHAREWLKSDIPNRGTDNNNTNIVTKVEDEDWDIVNSFINRDLRTFNKDKFTTEVKQVAQQSVNITYLDFLNDLMEMYGIFNIDKPTTETVVQQDVQSVVNKLTSMLKNINIV
ncbi:hypothetical protein NPIL_138391 [Nephila pilipes]|uniref:Uncharacterized protein n=1 Tax=Nephila pilipes TaxID=299642 RepID=A0A8X6UB69_NEPPI|nr:hypothetical protein NPIL_138391 [Nephila pilipes]